MCVLMTTDKFVEKAKSIHGDKYDYSKSIYINSNTKVEIGCRLHGYFFQQPNVHYHSKYCCRQCFLDSKKSIRSNPENINKHIPEGFSLITEYTDLRDKCIVKDSDGNLYETVFSRFLSGFKPSIRCALNPINVFTSRANKIHNNKYDYSKSVLGGFKNNITIVCPIHGEFTQRAYSHLEGRGCFRCGCESSLEYNINNPTGWSLSEWIKKANNSDAFDSFKVYLILCENEFESFVKIGRSFNTVDRRYMSDKMMPYNYTIIKIIEDNPYRIFKLESKLKRICKSKSYLPNISFKGMYECFTPDCLELLKDYINKD